MSGAPGLWGGVSPKTYVILGGVVRAIVLIVTWGWGGVENSQKKRYVIYACPLSIILFYVALVSKLDIGSQN